MLSGESGEMTIQETLLRVCKSKDVRPESLKETLRFGFQLPRLSDTAQLAELSRVIERRRIEVVIIDPIYLCLIDGNPYRRVDTSNLFDMGPLIRTVVTACQPATPLLVHHSKKNMTAKDGTFGRYGQPDLDDLSMAGFAEYARQWILLKRSERYEPASGVHKLWLSMGGSAGHVGEWEIEIREGTRQSNSEGRTWETSIKFASEVRAEREEQDFERKVKASVERGRANEAAREIKTADDAAKIPAALSTPMSRSQLRTKMGWGVPRVANAVEQALKLGTIEEATIGSTTFLRRPV